MSLKKILLTPSLNKDYTPSQYYITAKNIPYEVCNIIAETMDADVKILVDNETQACADSSHSPNKRKEALTADGVKGAMWTAKVIDDSCQAYYVLASSIATRYRNLKYNAVCKMP